MTNMNRNTGNDNIDSFEIKNYYHVSVIKKEMLLFLRILYDKLIIIV